MSDDARRAIYFSTRLTLPVMILNCILFDKRFAKQQTVYASDVCELVCMFIRLIYTEHVRIVYVHKLLARPSNVSHSKCKKAYACQGQIKGDGHSILIVFGVE